MVSCQNICSGKYVSHVDKDRIFLGNVSMISAIPMLFVRDRCPECHVTCHTAQKLCSSIIVAQRDQVLGNLEFTCGCFMCIYLCNFVESCLESESFNAFWSGEYKSEPIVTDRILTDSAPNNQSDSLMAQRQHLWWTKNKKRSTSTNNRR
jgi:hypothetical protein